MILLLILFLNSWYWRINLSSLIWSNSSAISIGIVLAAWTIAKAYLWVSFGKESILKRELFFIFSASIFRLPHPSIHLGHSPPPSSSWTYSLNISVTLFTARWLVELDQLKDLYNKFELADSATSTLFAYFSPSHIDFWYQRWWDIFWSLVLIIFNWIWANTCWRWLLSSSGFIIRI